MSDEREFSSPLFAYLVMRSLGIPEKRWRFIMCICWALWGVLMAYELWRGWQLFG